MKKHTARKSSPLILLAAVVLVTFGAASADEVHVDVDATRATIEKWVETRRIISQEERDWALGEEILSDRIELVQREIDEMRLKSKDAEASITEADKKLAEQVAESDDLKAAQASLHEKVASLEARTRELLARLPAFVRDRVKLLSQRLPDDSATATLELPDRFLNVIGILNDLNKFNGEITVTSELRDLKDGASAEVTTVYIGLGQAYYLGANNSAAGIGTAGADGWVWVPADSAAASIADVIAILENESVARFVMLPIEVK